MASSRKSDSLDFLADHRSPASGSVKVRNDRHDKILRHSLTDEPSIGAKKSRLPVACRRISERIPLMETGDRTLGLQRRRRMSSRLVVGAILTMVCVSFARAGDPVVRQPIIVSAPTVWPSRPVAADRPPVLIMDPPPRAVGANTGRIYTPLPHPGYAPTVTYKPLVPMMAVPQQYYFGRGIIGQPKLYVPGQPIRNVLRYLSL